MLEIIVSFLRMSLQLYNNDGFDHLPTTYVERNETTIKHTCSDACDLFFLGSGSSPQSPSDEQQTGVARPLGPAAKAKHIPVSSLARESTKAYEHIMRNTSQFNTPIVPGKKIKEWETLVLFAVNLSKLDVMVNMSNVMGNTV